MARTTRLLYSSSARLVIIGSAGVLSMDAFGARPARGLALLELRALEAGVEDLRDVVLAGARISSRSA